MCDRYYRRSDKQAIAEAFHISQVTGFSLPPWDYNVGPLTIQPIIRNDRLTGERELVPLRWGLIPFFTKSIAEFRGFSTITARGETVGKRRPYQEPFKKRRCMVPACGFYEWKQLDPKNKQAFGFRLANGSMMAFAGIWDAWKDRTTGKLLQSFSIVTTEANEMVAPCRNRMPIILNPDDFDRWLSRDETDLPPFDLLRPSPADEMEVFEANNAVGNVLNNGPEMLNNA